MTFYYSYNIVLTYALDSDIRNKFINQSNDSYKLAFNEIMLNKYNVLESKYKIEFGYFKIILIIILNFTYEN